MASKDLPHHIGRLRNEQDKAVHDTKQQIQQWYVMSLHRKLINGVDGTKDVFGQINSDRCAIFFKFLFGLGIKYELD